MAVKNYGIHDKWTDMDKLNIIDIKSVDGVIESVKINGEEAGGGGSSDFSTATVTVVGNINACIPYTTTIEMGDPFDALVAVEQIVTNGSQIPLYKGKLVIEIKHEVTVSGNIESLGNGMYLITGDCTITRS